MRTVAVDAVVLAVVAAASIAIALWITPMQRVAAAGQIVRVGATAPSWSLSGPAQLDLFGQHLPTTLTFAGPVRPRLELSRITLSQQLSEFTGTSGQDAGQSLEHALVAGWWHYFAWQITIVGIVALVLTGAASGWLRRHWRHTGWLLVIGVVLAEAINLGAIMTTAYSAPGKLRRVHSLQALVGGASLTPPADATTTVTGLGKVVVIGDSTAAGLGNRALPHATAQDKACGRSSDAYARALAAVNHGQVTNLACSGATIAAGLLGSQRAGSLAVPPQLDDPALAEASTVIVSIGANDVGWASMLQVCAVSAGCLDNAVLAYLQQQLAGFTTDYLELLTALQSMPNHPRVLINLYYDPFSSDVSCLRSVGMTEHKLAAIHSALSALNSVLSSGAKAASFTSVQPDFTGHGVCSEQPWVQGVHDKAAFHPTASGQWAIALTDEQALNTATPTG